MPLNNNNVWLGDMMYLNVLGQPFLILNSLQRTTDLLEKRSSNYSDRMRLPMLVELCVSGFSHLNHCQTFLFVQNEMGLCLPFSAVRRSVEEIQANFSRVFPPQRSAQLPIHSKARGSRLFASTASHAWQLPPSYSTVSVVLDLSLCHTNKTPLK